MIDDFFAELDASRNIEPSIDATVEVDSQLFFNDDYLVEIPDMQGYDLSTSVSNSFYSDELHLDFDNDNTLSNSHESIDSYDMGSVGQEPSMNQEITTINNTDEVVNTPSVDFHESKSFDSLYNNDPISFGGNMYDERAEQFIRDTKAKGIDVTPAISGKCPSGGVQFVDKNGIYRILEQAFKNKQLTEEEYKKFKDRVIGL
jgi:hypothetical protein